jgi:hypothetical protein
MGLARGAELFDLMAIDRLQHTHAREDHRAVVLRSLVTMRAAAWTFGIVCSDFGISFASPRVAGKDIGRGFYSPREIIPAWPTARSKSAFIATIRPWMFIGREGRSR